MSDRPEGLDTLQTCGWLKPSEETWDVPAHTVSASSHQRVLPRTLALLGSTFREKHSGCCQRLTTGTLATGHSAAHARSQQASARPVSGHLLQPLRTPWGPSAPRPGAHFSAEAWLSSALRPSPCTPAAGLVPEA